MNARAGAVTFSWIHDAAFTEVQIAGIEGITTCQIRLSAPARQLGRKGPGAVSWAVVQQLPGNVTPTHMYEPGSWGPTEANHLATDIGGGITCNDGRPFDD